ncbi:hypothetical protein [Flavobacterium sp. JP2137]|uniref:hypothetical protein n=1 Tax=Flavobacterium sp. JP2137 TaxID=3414510 RepID=UPI003D2FDCD3
MNKLKQRGIVFVFLSLFIATNMSAQDMYIKISEKDCSSCYSALSSYVFNDSDDHDYKLLFPENYRGLRFEKFNKTHFNQKLDLKKVVFSDDLITKSEPYLGQLSGLFVLDNQTAELLLYLKSEDFTKLPDVHKRLKSFKSVQNKLNFDNKGISERVLTRYSLSENKLFYVDLLYKNLYIVDGDGKVREFDFTDLNLDQIVEKSMDQTDYAVYLKNKKFMESIGKKSIDLFNLLYYNHALYIDFVIPKITETTVDGTPNYGIYNILKMAILSEEDLFNNQFNANIYDIDYDNNDEYYYTTNSLVRADKLYKLNQFIYAPTATTTPPLISELKIDESKKQIVFEKYLEDLYALDFQKQADYNTAQLINNIELEVFDQFILLKNHPYLIDVARKRTIQLEYQDPVDEEYTNHQVWRDKDDDYKMLISSKKGYSLYTYNKDFQFKKSTELHFSRAVKNAYFTNDKLFLITDKGVYCTSNFDN